MDTNKAIEFLESERNDYSYTVIRESYDQVISLLQQGEKYRQMWDGLKNIGRGYVSPNLRFLMQNIEDKYFPKEAKQDETDNRRNTVKQE